jgi:3-deoxy-manno-octulosonate cytidylyltransferase (CMP-KDO synthetase)
MESVINIQGDEPFIDPGQIDLVGETLKRKEVEIATLAKLLSSEDEIGDPNVVKVVFDFKNKALYFSRNPIPFLRSVRHREWAKEQAHFKHIGIYGYKSEVLTKLVKLPVSALERSESLEQLRWLENGYKIDIALTDRESVGIDIPEDLSKITNNT